MKVLTFYYDPVSPYAYLAFSALPQALAGHSYHLRYCPVLLGRLLQHWGQLGPAEIPPKRVWTYRHTFWRAQELNLALQMPTVHPFNPLSILLTALECALQNREQSREQSGTSSETESEPENGAPPATDSVLNSLVYSNRFVTETILAYVWNSGLPPLDESRLTRLRLQLSLPKEVHSDTRALVKAALRANTQAAVDKGVFGIPSIVADDQLFWGLEALPMLAQYLKGVAVLPPAQWNAAQNTVYGIPARR